MARSRIRDLGIQIGHMPLGQHNAITDVPEVLVGHATIMHDSPRVARTGVTMILPRNGEIARDRAFAGYYSFNGNGEMTGLLWLKESGMLGSPIGITNTHQVGIVRDSLVAYEIQNGLHGWFLPVVAETYDGFLNDIGAFHITQDHVFAAIASAKSGPVDEGNVGGGTGMMCHGFKGGIGTASRLAETPTGQYVVGALVQANYGVRNLLRVDGVPVGREISAGHTPLPGQTSPGEGSIIVIIATDAPLIPSQCMRVAQRATIGLARNGGVGNNGSGDIFLAFSTGNHLQSEFESLHNVRMLPQEHINPIFEAAAEAVEESILNALTAAETMIGFQGRTAHAIPLDKLKQVMAKYAPHD